MNYYSNHGYPGRKSGVGRGGCGCGCSGGAKGPSDYSVSHSPMYQVPYSTSYQSPYLTNAQVPYLTNFQSPYQKNDQFMHQTMNQSPNQSAYLAYRSDLPTSQPYVDQMPSMNPITTLPLPLPSKQSTPSPELLKLLEQAVGGETEDRIFYKQLIELAPTAADKEVIASIRDDELSHFKQFRQIYHDLTGKEISSPDEPTTEEQPQSYMAGLRKALFGEMAAVKTYRVIRSLLSMRAHRDMLFNIITDELTHMGKYNYLITINKRNS